VRGVTCEQFLHCSARVLFALVSASECVCASCV
jgi:hypothetical protein